MADNTEKTGAGARPHTGPSARMRAAILVGALATLAGGAGWYVWSDWAGFKPDAQHRPQRPAQTPEEQGEAQTPAVEFIPALRQAPALAVAEGAPFSLGTVTEHRNGVSATVTLRHVGGRGDPISMGQPRIEVRAQPGSYVTPPVVRTEGDSCFSKTARPDENGLYCRFNIQWNPAPDEELDATLSAVVEPYVSIDDRAAAKTMEDIPGGWPGYTFKMILSGRSSAALPPAELIASSTHLDWGDTTVGATEQALTITAVNRPINVGKITAFPTTGDIHLVAGRKGPCSDKHLDAGFERGERCTLAIEWTPAAERLRLSHELIIEWIEDDEDARPQETVVRLSGRSIIVSDDAGEAVLNLKPASINFGALDAGQTSESKRIRLAVSDHPAVIQKIAMTRTAAEAGLTIDSTGECLGIHAPGSQTNEAWCHIYVSATAKSDQAQAANKHEIEIVWHYPRRARSGGTDRYTLTLPVQWTVKGGREQPKAIEPATLAIEPEAVDFAQAEPADYERRVTLTNNGPEGATLAIVNVTLESTRLDARAGAKLATGTCTTGSAKLAFGEFCDLRIGWKATHGATLDAMIEVTWDSAGKRTRTPIALTGSGTPEPESLEAPPKIGGPAPTVEVVETRRDRARAEVRRRGALPALQSGVGIVEMTPAQLALADPESARRHRVIDADLAALGVEWATSSRPIDLSAIVVENAPIHIVLVQRVNAAFNGPVTAMVQRPVWGGHGRARVIERGARVIGYTRGLSGIASPGTAAAVPQKGASQGKGAPNVAGARLNVRWRYLMRPDGSSFLIEGDMATGDVMGQQGLPVIMDPYEWERYIAMVGNAGLRALAILASPERRILKTMTTDEGGKTTEGFQHVPTRNELAAQELIEGFQNVTLVMQALQTPQPAIIVPAGTRGVLTPLRGLVLRPIETIEPAPAQPGTLQARAIANQITAAGAPGATTAQGGQASTRAPLEPEELEARDRARASADNQEGLAEFQRTPEGVETMRRRIVDDPASTPGWAGEAHRAGSAGSAARATPSTTESGPALPPPTRRQAPVPAPTAPQRPQPSWTGG